MGTEEALALLYAHAYAMADAMMHSVCVPQRAGSAAESPTRPRPRPERTGKHPRVYACILAGWP